MFGNKSSKPQNRIDCLIGTGFPFRSLEHLDEYVRMFKSITEHTAGIRRPGRVARAGQVESLSVLVARRAIEKADVVVLVVDASAGATDQDATIAGEADKAGRFAYVAASWDEDGSAVSGLLMLDAR